MSKFGWSYPAGAANDPNAPWNQEETPDNSAIVEAFPDFSGPYELYRAVYKYTACGPTIGFTFCYESEDNGEWGPGGTGGENITATAYGDDLRKWGTWETLSEKGVLITGINVSSIVEGVDQCTETVTLDMVDFLGWDAERVTKEFWAAVSAVNQEAESIWQDTHGCDTCAEYWDSKECTFTLADCPVWAECPNCHGAGMVI